MKHKWFSLHMRKEPLEETESVFVDVTAILSTDDSSVKECKTVSVK
jgi:hypothetical protein